MKALLMARLNAEKERQALKEAEESKREDDKKA